MPHVVVLGARNLGRVIAEHLIADGWEATGIARSEETAAAFPGTRHRGRPHRPRADAGRVRPGRPVRPGGQRDVAEGRFGGGDLITTDDEAMAPYLEQLLPVVFDFFRIAGASAAARGSGTLVQVTGGSARRALPGRAPWGAGAAATRALSQAAANELRENGVHVALLICDGSFGGAGDDRDGKAIDTLELAKAVRYLHDQGRSAWTHELVVTPIGDRWTP